MMEDVHGSTIASAVAIPRPASVTLHHSRHSSHSSFTGASSSNGGGGGMGNGPCAAIRPAYSQSASTMGTPPSSQHLHVSTTPSMSSPRDPSPASSDSSASADSASSNSASLQLSPTHAERPHEHMGFFRPPRGVGTRASPLEPLSRMRTHFGGQIAVGAVPATAIAAATAVPRGVISPTNQADLPRSNSISFGVPPIGVHPIVVTRSRSSSVILPPLAPTSHPVTPAPGREAPFLDLDAVPSMELPPQLQMSAIALQHANSYSYPSIPRPSILSTFDLSAPLSQSQPGPDRNRAISPFPVDDPRIGIGTLHTQELTSTRPFSPELDAEDLALAPDLIDVRSPRTDPNSAFVPPVVSADDPLNAALDIRSPRPMPLGRATSVRGAPIHPQSLLAAQVLAASQTRAPLAMHGQYGHGLHGPIVAVPPPDLCLGQGLGLPAMSTSPVLTSFGSTLAASHSPTHAAATTMRPPLCLSPAPLLPGASFDSFGNGGIGRRPAISPRLDKSRSSPGPSSSDGTPRKHACSPLSQQTAATAGSAEKPVVSPTASSAAYLHLSTPGPVRPTARSAASARLTNSMDSLDNIAQSHPAPAAPVHASALAPREVAPGLVTPTKVMPQPLQLPRSIGVSRASSTLSPTRTQLAFPAGDAYQHQQRGSPQASSSSAGTSPSNTTSFSTTVTAATTSLTHRAHKLPRSNIVASTPQVFSSC